MFGRRSNIKNFVHNLIEKYGTNSPFELCKKLNINILNVNQTIMDGYFTMIMMLDQSNANESFDEIKKRLSQKGQDLKVDVKIQREEIFNSMHSL